MRGTLSCITTEIPTPRNGTSRPRTEGTVHHNSQCAFHSKPVGPAQHGCGPRLALQHLVRHSSRSEMRLTSSSSHVATPKYKCPRCSSRNCSLPCYKRHKILADCSGIRDPTAYVKKSALYTPAGVDHDFNFLSSVIMNVSKTEQDPTVWRNRTIASMWRRKRADEFWQRVKNMGLTIHHAPMGISRARKNYTRYIRKCVHVRLQWPIAKCF
jgi:hypothetical protein